MNAGRTPAPCESITTMAEEGVAPKPRGMTLQGAAALMIFATLGSRITGMIRMMVLAHYFGASGQISAFYQALIIPDLVYFLIAGGALKTGFVPVLSEYLARGEKDKIWHTFSTLFWLLLMVGGLVVVGGIVFAPALAYVVVPGWVAKHPDLVKPCGEMMRILFPAQLFFLLGGGLFMGALNAHKHFLWPGIGPIVYNLFIIAGAVAASALLGLETVAYAVVLGAFVGNFLLQIPPLLARGARLQATFNLRDEGVTRVLKLAAPVILSLAVAEINWVIVKILASYPGEHGPAILEYANRLWKLPSGVFAAGIAIALLPSLSEDYALGDESKYTRDFSFGLRNAVFLVLPATVAIGVLRVPIVRLLFEHGGFLAADTMQVADVLLWLTPGMVALGVVYILARAFYARHDTVTPVIAGIISVLVCAGLGLILLGPLELVGLAIATSAGGAANASLLLVLLKRKVTYLDGARIARSLLRLLPGCIGMGLLMWLGMWLAEQQLGTLGVGPRLVGLLVPLAMGSLAFVGLAWLCRCEELGSAWRLVRRGARS